MDEPRVVIDGDRVRRPAYPWTPTVHALLRHLREAGLEVPEPLDIEHGVGVIDSLCIGTEVVTFLPGVAGFDEVWPLQVSDEGLVSAARLLRANHDAAATFVPPEDAVWALPPRDGEPTTVCHGDPGPYNMVWRGGAAVAMFDWEFARPGPVLDDVAYALEYLAPLRSDEACQRYGFPTPPDRARRVRLFLDAYGLEVPDIADAMLERKERADVEALVLAAQGMGAQDELIAEGYFVRSAEQLAWGKANRHLFTP